MPLNSMQRGIINILFDTNMLHDLVRGSVTLLTSISSVGGSGYHIVYSVVFILMIP